MKFKTKVLTSYLALGAVLVLGFQNCSNASSFSNLASNSSSSGEPKAPASSGNGDSYDGKPDIYRFYDPANVCAETAQGKPLPNQQIHLFKSKAAQLVRHECKDVEPMRLGMSVTENDDGTVQYSGQRYNPHVPATFEVMSAQCPAGLSPRANASRQNLFDAPLDLSDITHWGSVGNVSIVPHGSIAGLPAHLVTRLTSGEDAPRADQYRKLEPNTSYALSFFARMGTSTKVMMMMWSADPEEMAITLHGDLITGTTTASNSRNTIRYRNVSMVSRVAPGGFFFTVYFTTPSQLDGSDIGFAAADEVKGASVSIADAQLETVRSFCE